MPVKKMSELTEATTIDGNDILDVSIRDGAVYTSKKVEADTLAEFVSNSSAISSTYLTQSNASAIYIPYSGAISNIDLNSKSVSNVDTITTTNVVANNVASTIITDNTLSITGGEIENVGHILFDLNHDDPAEEGILQWNDDDGTLNVGLKGGNVTLQVGQETVVRGVNKSGVIIPNGSPVYISGSQGNRPTFDLTNSTSAITSRFIGLTTEEIGKNNNGYVTVFGQVRDIDTSGTPYGQTWNEGDLIYISNVAGKLTNEIVEAPDFSSKVGIVLNAHASEGVILIQPEIALSVEDLRDVDGTPFDTSGQILVYDAVNNYWDADRNINDYLTTSNAASTYLTQSNAASSYLLLDGSNSPVIDLTNSLLIDNSTTNSVDWANRLLYDTSGTIVLDYGSKLLYDNMYNPSIDWNDRYLYDSSSNTVHDWNNRLFYTQMSSVSINYDSGFLFDANGATSIDWMTRYIYDSMGTNSIDYENRFLYDSSNNFSFDWNNKQLYGTSNVAIDYSVLINYDGMGVASLEWGNRWLKDSSGNTAIEYDSRLLSDGTQYSIDWSGRFLYDSAGGTSIDYGSRLTSDSTSTYSIDWDTRYLYDTSGNTSIDWGSKLLSDGTQFSMDWGARFLYDSGGGTSLDYGTRLAVDNMSTNSIDWDSRFLYDNVGNNVFDYSDGNIHVVNDSEKLYFGAGDDYSIEFDGTNGLHTLATGGTVSFEDATISVRQTGDISTLMTQDSNRSFAGAPLGGIISKWNGTNVSRIRMISGDDAVNKDDGEIVFGTYQGGVETEVMRMTQEGHVKLPNDSEKLYFGAGDDASISFGGTNLVIESDIIGSGDLVVNATSTGNVRLVQGGGDVGIGGTPSANRGLHIIGDSVETEFRGGTSVANGIFQTTYRNLTGQNQYVGNYARGTKATPLIVQDDDLSLLLTGRGYDGSDFQSLGSIGIRVDGIPGVSDMPGRIEFSTTPNGSGTLVERMRIDNAGNVGIGTTDPLATTHIKTSSNGYTGALSVNYDDFAIENTGNCGMTIMSGNSNNGAIAFGDAADAVNGLFLYNHGSDQFRWYVGSTSLLAATLDNAGYFGLGIDPACPLHIYKDDATTGSNAGITIEQDGTGDPVIQFLTTGVERFIIGIDNSDGDKFKISESDALGTNDIIVFDPTTDDIHIPNDSEKLYFGAGDDYSIEWNASDAVHTITSGDFAFTGGSLSIFDTNDNADGHLLVDTDAENARIVLRNDVGTGPTGQARIVMSSTTGTEGLRFQMGTSDAMIIDENSNVGIGTTTPNSLLHINASSPTITLEDTGVAGDPAIQFSRVSIVGNIGGKIWLDNSAGDMYFDNWYDSNAGDIRFRTKTYGTPIDAMTISGDGNVGIGTTTPTVKLDIDGDNNVANFGDSSFSDKYISIRKGLSGSAYFGLDTTVGSGSGAAIIQSGASKDIGFITNTDTFGNTANVRMLITPDGDVKIPNDSKKLYFGAGDDASIYYDGTNLNVSPKEVGSGYMVVNGDVQINDSSAYLFLRAKNASGGGAGVVYQSQTTNKYGWNFLQSNDSHYLYDYTNTRIALRFLNGNLELTPHADVKILEDNKKLYFGAGDDYSIEFDATDAVHTLTAGDFVFTGGEVGVDNKILHNGDSDTYWQFLDDRALSIVGGTRFFDFETTGQKTAIFGGALGAGNDINWSWNVSGMDNVFTIDGNTGKIGINVATALAPLHVETAAFSNSASSRTGIFLTDSDGTAGQGNYGGSIEFGRIASGSNKNAAIAAKQTGADADQMGLSFFTHPSATFTDPTVESMLISHDGILTINGAYALPNSDGTAGEVLATDGAGTVAFKTVTVDVPINLSMFDAVPVRASESNWNGGLEPLVTAQPLNPTPTNIVISKGTGKFIVVVNAGSDLVGTITVTGDSVNRDTGAITVGDTDTITVDGLTTDGSTTDGNGNTIHSFADAYITNKWFTGTVTLSTADVTLTDVDVYHISFDQFNDQSNITLNSFDANIYTTNANAEFDAYLYSIHRDAGSKCHIDNEAALNVGTNGQTAIANKYWRLRKGDINEDLDGTTDGVWADVYYSNAPVYVEDVTLKIWATKHQSLTLS